MPFPFKTEKIFTRQLAFSVACFLCCFLLAFLIFFPLEPFSRKLEAHLKKQGIILEIRDAGKRFPLSIAVETLDLSLDQLDHPPIRLSRLTLSPLWFSLPGDNQGVQFSFEAFQGQIEGSTFKKGNTQAELRGLVINEPLEPALPLTIKATLENAIFDGTLPLEGTNRSNLDFVLNDLRIEGLQNFGGADQPLAIGDVTGALEAKGRQVQIRALNSTGAAMEIKGTGTLNLGRTARNSSLNLNLVLTPKAGLDPALKDLLALLKRPQPDGSYLLNIRGSLANPRIN